MPKAKTLKASKPEKRALLTPSQFAALLAAVPVACQKNAEQFADYLRFLAYTSSREQEALKVRWEDVDMAGEKVTIGAGGVSKNHEARSVEFSDKLGALLSDMAKRRAPDCSWIFPSPQRGPRDEHARTFRESLILTRKAAGLAWVGFHDLRHFFASFCVMAGLDFMTIAAWLEKFRAVGDWHEIEWHLVKRLVVNIAEDANHSSAFRVKSVPCTRLDLNSVQADELDLLVAVFHREGSVHPRKNERVHPFRVSPNCRRADVHFDAAGSTRTFQNNSSVLMYSSAR
jgi:hypothetical protein